MIVMQGVKVKELGIQVESVKESGMSKDIKMTEVEIK